MLSLAEKIPAIAEQSLLLKEAILGKLEEAKKASPSKVGVIFTVKRLSELGNSWAAESYVDAAQYKLLLDYVTSARDLSSVLNVFKDVAAKGRTAKMPDVMFGTAVRELVSGLL
jgi:hypothetical protein